MKIYNEVTLYLADYLMEDKMSISILICIACFFMSFLSV